MSIGFTGTKKGMTTDQRSSVLRILNSMKNRSVVHHGGCVGADIDFDSICFELGKIRVIHPSNIHSMQGKWHYTEHYRPEKPPLERNKDIVNESRILIATPSQFSEVTRSGTWFTIRYARNCKVDYKKIIYIILPDGTIEV